MNEKLNESISHMLVMELGDALRKKQRLKEARETVNYDCHFHASELTTDADRKRIEGAHEAYLRASRQVGVCRRRMTKHYNKCAETE